MLSIRDRVERPSGILIFFCLPTIRLSIYHSKVFLWTNWSHKRAWNIVANLVVNYGPKYTYIMFFLAMEKSVMEGLWKLTMFYLGIADKIIIRMVYYLFFKGNISSTEPAASYTENKCSTNLYTMYRCIN